MRPMLRVMTRALGVSCLLTAAATGAAVSEEYRWSGLYGGLNAGYAWNSWDWPGASPYVAPPVPMGVDSGPPNQNLSGALFGGTLGYNQQFDRFVVGVEGDFAFSDISGSERDGNYIVETGRLQNFATLRARAGVLVTPSLLAYATAGVAFENLEYGESCPEPAAVSATGSWCAKHGAYDLKKSQWNTGYVVGGGLEWMVAEHVSLKLEGLYADFGANDYDLGTMGDGNALPGKRIESSETLLKVGVNYHF